MTGCGLTESAEPSMPGAGQYPMPDIEILKSVSRRLLAIRKAVTAAADRLERINAKRGARTAPAAMMTPSRSTGHKAVLLSSVLKELVQEVFRLGRAIDRLDQETKNKL